MKLIYRIIIRLSIIISIILTAWAIFFYYAIIDEVNDEIDDNLEEYSEQIIMRALAGKALPTVDDGSNNSFHITETSATLHHGIEYSDAMIYIESKNEMEPARILKTIFKNKDGLFYELTVSTPTIEKNDLREAILYWIITLYFTLLIIIVLINILVYWSSMKPLYKLLHWLDHYKIGANNEPLKNDTKITEFRKLNDSALRYTERIEEDFEQQRQFIGNASHELQTPLAICQNRLEMLTNDENLTETQLIEIAKTQQTLSHLVRLNKSLLLLSKIENRQFPESTLVNFNELIKNHLTDFKEIFEHLHINIIFHKNGILTARINESLASAMISNLLRNAFIHNRLNGEIVIEISENHLFVANTGNEQPLNKNQIFNRFYQGSKKNGSTGLGLAIVEAICKIYEVTIEYSFKNRKHGFELFFQKSIVD